MTNTTPAANRPPLSDAERKARERARYQQLDIKRVEIKLSQRERDQLAQLCRLRAAGSEPYTADEYLSTLIRRDWERWQDQEKALAGRTCQHCQQPLPAGCGGAFDGEQACWITKGKEALAI